MVCGDAARARAAWDLRDRHPQFISCSFSGFPTWDKELWICTLCFSLGVRATLCPHSFAEQEAATILGLELWKLVNAGFGNFHLGKLQL